MRPPTSLARHGRFALLPLRSLSILPLLALVVTGVSLWLRESLPPLVFASASYDDLYFVRQAHDLLTGHWLGHFDPNVTLSKGVGYPTFLAVAHLLHLPYLLAQQMLHLVASACFAFALTRVTRSRALGYGTYIAMALDPTQMGVVASRPVRDSFYASLCLLVLAGFSLLLIQVRPGPRMSSTTRIGLSCAVGAALGAYWLTREERPWLLPAIAVLLIGGAWQHRMLARSAPRLAVLRSATLLLPLAVVFVGLVGAVTLANRAVYGVSLTNDLTEGGFARAYAAWQSVRAGTSEPFVPINHASRQAVFAISPAARELQPYLEGGYETGWTGPGCQEMHVCNDVAAGWMPWMLRSALTLSGRHPSASEGQSFWNRLADEIETACKTHRLPCTHRMPLFLPEPDTLDLGRYQHSLGRAVKTMYSFRLAADSAVRSDGQPKDWAEIRRTLVGLPRSQRSELKRESMHGLPAIVRGVLADSYRLAAIPLTALALVGAALSACRRRGPWLWVFATLVTAVVARLGFLALVDSTAFPTLTSSYVLPACAMLVPAAFLGTWSLAHALRPNLDPPLMQIKTTEPVPAHA